ncbi:hypothetical protein [Pseudomonas lopnurensis]|uniref:hypothetical protein n=1 Tax=Pseudomonas lopnurensis TaxID=1477517 RepID=UPI00187939AC|nr:hypothetical protein [Pseudomonas lopnurensis]MBE7374080.1 hypothetical protein [Pseudomonas lopnurensis]
MDEKPQRPQAELQPAELSGRPARVAGFTRPTIFPASSFQLPASSFRLPDAP